MNRNRTPNFVTDVLPYIAVWLFGICAVIAIGNCIEWIAPK